MSVCMCVSKSLPTHFRHIVFNSDPNTYFVLFLLKNLPSLMVRAVLTHRSLTGISSFFPSQMESMYKEQPSANDFSPAEM